MRVVSLLAIVSVYILTTTSAHSAFLIDINSGSSPTASGFVGLDGSNGSSATDQGATFTVYGSLGTRERSGPLATDDLTLDFAFNDESQSLSQVGLEITGLAAGLYQASVWSFDPSNGPQPTDISPEFIGYETDTGSSWNSAVTIGLAQATDPALVFTFAYDPTTDGDLRIFAQGGSGALDSRRARFNALELTAIPIPAAFWLFSSGLLGLVGMARRKKA